MSGKLLVCRGTETNGFASKVIFHLGLAVRCAAAALPRRKLVLDVGLRPGLEFSNSPQKGVSGRSPQSITSTWRRGKATASHRTAKAVITLAHYF